MPADFPGSRLPHVTVVESVANQPPKRSTQIVNLSLTKDAANSLEPLVEKVLKNPLPNEEFTWLKELVISAKDAFRTGSQVYGQNYLTENSDHDVMVKVTKKDLGIKLLSLKADPDKHYSSDTCRVRIGDVDFILTASHEVFNKWKEITEFLKEHPPQNKHETVTMFDLMNNGKDYKKWWDDKYSWAAPFIDDVGKYVVGGDFDGQKIIGLEKFHNDIWYVLDGHIDAESPAGLLDKVSNYPKYSKIYGNIERGQKYYFTEAAEDITLSEHPQGKDLVYKEQMEEPITTSDEQMMDEAMMDEPMNDEENKYKKALKSSGHKMKGHIKHGMAVGAATEGASYAYQQVANVLKTQFGVSEETLQDPLKRELITFAALAVTHMGATVFDEMPGMEKVTKGCELAIEGKAKDNTGALIQHLLPMLLNVSKAMDPEAQMKRIMADAEKQRVEALDTSDEDAHAEVTAAMEQQDERKAKA